MAAAAGAGAGAYQMVAATNQFVGTGTSENPPLLKDIILITSRYLNHDPIATRGLLSTFRVVNFVSYVFQEIIPSNLSNKHKGAFVAELIFFALESHNVGLAENCVAYVRGSPFNPHVPLGQEGEAEACVILRGRLHHHLPSLDQFNVDNLGFVFKQFVDERQQLLFLARHLGKPQLITQCLSIVRAKSYRFVVCNLIHAAMVKGVTTLTVPENRTLLDRFVIESQQEVDQLLSCQEPFGDRYLRLEALAQLHVSRLHWGDAEVIFTWINSQDISSGYQLDQALIRLVEFGDLNRIRQAMSLDKVKNRLTAAIHLNMLFTQLVKAAVDSQKSEVLVYILSLRQELESFLRTHERASIPQIQADSRDFSDAVKRALELENDEMIRLLMPAFEEMVEKNNFILKYARNGKNLKILQLLLTKLNPQEFVRVLQSNIEIEVAHSLLSSENYKKLPLEDYEMLVSKKLHWLDGDHLALLLADARFLQIQPRFLNQFFLFNVTNIFQLQMLQQSARFREILPEAIFKLLRCALDDQTRKQRQEQRMQMLQQLSRFREILPEAIFELLRCALDDQTRKQRQEQRMVLRANGLDMMVMGALSFQRQFESIMRDPDELIPPALESMPDAEISFVQALTRTPQFLKLTKAQFDQLHQLAKTSTINREVVGFFSALENLFLAVELMLSLKRP